MLRVSGLGRAHASFVLSAQKVQHVRGCTMELSSDMIFLKRSGMAREAQGRGFPYSRRECLRVKGVRHFGGARICRISSRQDVCKPESGKDSRFGDASAGLQAESPSKEADLGLPKTFSPPSFTKPLLLKRHSRIPKDWDGPTGTAVLVDKPKGWTSFAVCAKLRSLTKVKKVGHAGTLDPMATGLLVLCLGKATRVVDRYQAMTKVYSGTLRLGELTPSADADTEVTDRLPWEHIQDTDLEAAAQKFLGEILQVPPMYSAIKVKGERLYEKARRGEELDIPPRMVTVSEFQLTRSEQNRQDVDFRVVCSKGTYIRSLCTDVGLALNSYAHLVALRREKIGDLSVEDAWTVADLQLEYSRLYL